MYIYNPSNIFTIIYHLIIKAVMVIHKSVFTLHVPVLAVAVVNVNVAAVAAFPESIYTEKRSIYIICK